MMSQNHLKSFVENIVREAILKEMVGGNLDANVATVRMTPNQRQVVAALMQRKFRPVKYVDAGNNQVSVVLEQPYRRTADEGNRFANVAPNGLINRDKLDLKTFLKGVIGEVMFGQERDDHRFDDGREPVMRAVNVEEANTSKKEGDTVQVADGSGIDSGKIGVIVPTKFKQTGGGLIPDEPGAYKPQPKGRWLSVKFEDGHVASFPANRLQIPFSFLKGTDKTLKEEPDEQTGSGAAGAYSTPFAFKKKKVKERIMPDGRYDDDMESALHSKRISGMSEATSALHKLDEMDTFGMGLVATASGIMIYKILRNILDSMAAHRDWEKWKNQRLTPHNIDMIFKSIKLNHPELKDEELYYFKQEVLGLIDKNAIRTIDDLKRYFETKKLKETNEGKIRDTLVIGLLIASGVGFTLLNIWDKLFSSKIKKGWKNVPLTEINIDRLLNLVKSKNPSISDAAIQQAKVAIMKAVSDRTIRSITDLINQLKSQYGYKLDEVRGKAVEYSVMKKVKNASYKFFKKNVERIRVVYKNTPDDIIFEIYLGPDWARKFVRFHGVNRPFEIWSEENEQFETAPMEIKEIKELGGENNILFTPQLFKKLKIEYYKAIKNNKESFIFEGHEVLVSYAKYLIQYLESKFGKVNEMTSSGAAGAYQTPFAFSKNKDGSKRAMDVTNRMGFKKVKSISE